MVLGLVGFLSEYRADHIALNCIASHRIPVSYYLSPSPLTGISSCKLPRVLLLPTVDSWNLVGLENRGSEASESATIDVEIHEADSNLGASPMLVSGQLHSDCMPKLC